MPARPIGGSIAMKRSLLGLLFVVLTLPSAALAQEGTVMGAASGAAAGALIGGPIGAVVGGVGGAVVGTIVAPPPAEVRAYVAKEEVPSVSRPMDLVVGQPLPRSILVRPVPGYRPYGYAVVNNRRLIVELRSRKIVEVLQ
jgi:hypothetical protein